VIIGANGAGKSNFILVFKLIKDILADSLKKAFENLGGPDYVKNIFMVENKDLISLKYTMQIVSELTVEKPIAGKNIKLTVKELENSIKIKVGANDCGFEVLQDELKIKYEYFENKVKIGASELFAKRDGDKIALNLENYDSFDYELERVFPNSIIINKNPLTCDELIIHKVFAKLLDIELSKTTIPLISIYEFEQDLLTSIKANNYNLADKESKDMFMTLLNSTLNNEDKKRQFFNYLNYVLPDIDDVSIDPKEKKFKNFMVKERYNKRYIPANFLSDGTVFLIVIILALYFDDKYLTIFDEPERRIHPHIISKVIDMMKDVSRNKQIILSTHNTEIVKYSGLESIILVDRDDDGYSSISRPSKREEINVFLENEIGLDELFVQNLLG
jgi:predicted ATPase